jgi:DUF1365 family protein
MESAIYSGTLTHRRYHPRRHQFTYSLFIAFLDIDRVPELMRVSPFSSYNRWNWAAFDERDHFGDASLPLRERLAADARASGITLPDGPIFLLAHLRYLGYNFNPVSFFYCYDGKHELQTILAEVNNTFGESRNYWLSPDPVSVIRLAVHNPRPLFDEPWAEVKAPAKQHFSKQSGQASSQPVI